MKKMTTSLVALAAMGFTINGFAAASGVTDAVENTNKQLNNIYIIQVAGEPVLTYDGTLGGLAATMPKAGVKLNQQSTHVKSYVHYLDGEHDAILKSVSDAGTVYNYRFAFNGFAAILTAEQVASLRKNPKVLNIWQDQLMQPQTNSTPNYIGVSGEDGAWDEGYVGEDVVIGIVDTGVQPDHPSLADTKTPKHGDRGHKIAYGAPPASWTGTGCDFGNDNYNPNDAPFACNNKLLKAEAFGAAFRALLNSYGFPGDSGFVAGEFMSARDSSGHGTHTMTTAGGNNGVEAFLNGVSQGKVSGIAPRARVAAYKVCWESVLGGGCFSADSAAAIDQAVADGVDVINFSIGGSGTTFNRADSIAFLFAAADGVWVAASAGNSGPSAETMGTPAAAPWLTAVAATQDDEVFALAISVDAPAAIAGDKTAFEGGGPVQLADTGIIGGDVVVTSPANGCAPLTNTDLRGKIALTIRGACAFSDKYNNAAAAGAVAIVVYNDGANAGRIDPIVMSAPGTTIPGAMVSYYDGADMAAELGVIVTLDPANQVSRASRIAGFSSRGANVGAPDIIKPDIAAPGVNIIAGNTLFPNSGEAGSYFQRISGTSMSSPHVAGAYAIMKQAHPDWSPAMARSALMTTARQNLQKTFGAVAADPFDIGAGEMVPSAALDPELVYDANIIDYVRFTCGADVQPQLFTQGTCDMFGAIDSSDLNLASIAIGELTGTQTITRTVTRVAEPSDDDDDDGDDEDDEDRDAKTYSVTVEAPAGVDVSVWPSTISLAIGESATYHVTFSSNANVAYDQWSFGALTWNKADEEHGMRGGRGMHKMHEDRDDDEGGVRSPIAIFPIAFGAPAAVTGTGTDASVRYDVVYGYNGDFTASIDGLAEGAVVHGLVADADANIEFFYVPAGTTLARFSTFDADIGASNDLDLEVYGPDGDGFPFVGSSGTATSEEEVNIENPVPGVYAAVVVDYASTPGDTAYAVYNFNLNGADQGNATVTAPATAASGTTGAITIDWTGLVPGTRYLGIMNYGDGTDALDAQTTVLINTH